MPKEMLSSRLQLSHVKATVAHIEHNFSPKQDWLQEIVQDYFDVAAGVVSRMNRLSPNPEQGRCGGVMMIHQPGEGDTGFTAIQVVGRDDGGSPKAIDEVEVSNVDKHTLYVLGKGLILAGNRTLLGSSLQNTLPEAQRPHLQLRGKDIPGGAIRIKGKIYSFSGYSTPEEDECVILATLERKGTLTSKSALAFAGQLNNTLYAKIRSVIVG